MPAEPAIDTELQAELARTFAFYFALARGLDGEAGLGGHFLYAGELDGQGISLMRAANIAGSASLCVAPDPELQRRAIRQGVIDFLVTNLDEALRILKNEIRKRNGVAVAVSTATEQVLAEMRERGVLPGLLRSEDADFQRMGALIVTPAALPPGREMLVFPTPDADFESRVLALIPESEEPTRRWVRLSQRYLGPDFRRMRSVPCTPECRNRLHEAFPDAVAIHL